MINSNIGNNTDRNVQSNHVLVWRWVEGFLIQFVGKGKISDAVWDKLVAEIRHKRAKLKGVLVFTIGSPPSASQRLKLREVIDHGPPLPTAILTGSAVVRAAMTALSYFLPESQRPHVFALDKINEAMTCLEIPIELHSVCSQTISELRLICTRR